MKKILHIAEPFATGVLSFLVDITERQVENYEIYIAYGIRPLTPVNVESLFDKRIHLIRLDSFKGAVRSVINWKAYRDIHKLYKEIKPDIVHLHSSASGFIGRWTLPCNKVKVFYTPHGFSFLMKDGLFVKRFIFWVMEYFSAKRKAQIVACSEGEYKEAIKLSLRSAFVNNGINIADLVPYITECRNSSKRITICTSGRILYQKNPFQFNAIALAMPDVKFIWIGEGKLRTELTAPNIQVTGWVTRCRALEIIRNVDFFVLTSLWEGLPISLLEAMYLKKVCLVSDVIGNRDVIRDGENGFICSSTLDYVARIRELQDDNQNAFIIADRASEDVLNNYNTDIMAKRYNEIYNQNF